MARLLATIFLAFIANPLSAQNVSLDQLISLRTKSLGYVEEFLSAKNWVMTNASEETESSLGAATFAFEKSSYEDKAISFITYMYGGVSNRISMQINKTTVYNVFLAKLKALGYKLQSSAIKDGKIQKIYKKDSITIAVKTATQEDDYSTKTTYTFLVCTSLDYSLQFGD